MYPSNHRAWLASAGLGPDSRFVLIPWPSINGASPAGMGVGRKRGEVVRKRSIQPRYSLSNNTLRVGERGDKGGPLTEHTPCLSPRPICNHSEDNESRQ